jgi:PAS domain S-box-containing protein
LAIRLEDYLMSDNKNIEGQDLPSQVETLLAAPDLADALESPQFRRFLDQVPIAIAVSEISGSERIIYANPEFERVSGQSAAALEGMPWNSLAGQAEQPEISHGLGEAIVELSDFVGTFRIVHGNEEQSLVDVYSSIIEDESAVPCYRLAALIDVTAHETEKEELDRKIREKETLLFEIQHRVKNNLQMITALIRIEARNARGHIDTAPFRRLAGRIESIQLLYSTLVEHGAEGEVDLGLYVSEIATSVLRAHAVEGIRLDLKVDTYPVSVNVAMPTGLVINELLTNALKHAFVGRDGGTIMVHSLSDGAGCRITVADDGVGLPPDSTWPNRGKLSALIVESLRTNAKAKLNVSSEPGKGMRVTIEFSRAAVAPEKLS